MKYFAIDIETTGLDRAKHQIIQVAIAVVNTAQMENLDELPMFTVRVEHKGYTFENSDAWVYGNFGQVMKNENYPLVKARDLMNEIDKFVKIHAPLGGITLAGKNIAWFDVPFLVEHENKYKMNELQKSFFLKNIHNRMLDVGSMYAVEHAGNVIPSLSTIVQIIGWDRWKTHDAQSDVKAVAAAINYRYHGECEYREQPVGAKKISRKAEKK
jgi:oligoribonuclease (3'-5' exoribonuclease)